MDFKNTDIVMTSNAGASTLKKQRTLGFGSADSAEKTYESMKESVMGELKQIFRPEFLNRVDEIIVFHSLEEGDILAIARLMMNAVAKRLQERGVELAIDESAVKLLAKSGFDPQYGARPLRRAIQRMVEDSLSEELLSGSIHMGERVQVSAEGDQLKFTPISPENGQAAEAQATSAPAI